MDQARTDDAVTGSEGKNRELHDPRFGQRYVILKAASKRGGDETRYRDAGNAGAVWRNDPRKSAPMGQTLIEVSGLGGGR